MPSAVAESAARVARAPKCNVARMLLKPVNDLHSAANSSGATRPRASGARVDFEAITDLEIQP